MTIQPKSGMRSTVNYVRWSKEFFDAEAALQDRRVTLTACGECGWYPCRCDPDMRSWPIKAVAAGKP